jgi:hypothetical protein
MHLGSDISIARLWFKIFKRHYSRARTPPRGRGVGTTCVCFNSSPIMYAYAEERSIIDYHHHVLKLRTPDAKLRLSISSKEYTLKSSINGSKKLFKSVGFRGPGTKSQINVFSFFKRSSGGRLRLKRRRGQISKVFLRTKFIENRRANSCSDEKKRVVVSKFSTSIT